MSDILSILTNHRYYDRCNDLYYSLNEAEINKLASFFCTAQRDTDYDDATVLQAADNLIRKRLGRK